MATVNLSTSDFNLNEHRDLFRNFRKFRTSFDIIEKYTNQNTNKGYKPRLFFIAASSTGLEDLIATNPNRCTSYNRSQNMLNVLIHKEKKIEA